MEYIKKIGKITNKGYREMFPEISNETARLDLSTLVRKKLLNKRGEYPKFIPNFYEFSYFCENIFLFFLANDYSLFTND